MDDNNFQILSKQQIVKLMIVFQSLYHSHFEICFEKVSK